MSLESYLRAFGKAGSNQAFPSIQHVELNADTEIYTPKQSGYLAANIEPMNPGDGDQSPYLGFNQDDISLGETLLYSGYGQWCTRVAVRGGTSVGIYKGRNMRVLRLVFIPSLGGA